ncbi:MAG TPA: phosphoribosylanthranilate isomerase [Blastocatellia bacterium]|nr:phosphoribosylanthranilate isomerase [Blastocatellia bacterium]
MAEASGLEGGLEGVMLRVRVKICGIRTTEEAALAVELGADALGFNFWEGSPRRISPDEAARIINALPPLVSSVGVFVNESQDTVRFVAMRLRLAAVQLHGDESPEYCAGLGPLKTIKALRVGPGFSPESVKEYPSSTILLDSRVAGSYGGTGQQFDWRAAIEARQYARIILAGGLNVANVEDAIQSVRPVAIDVCSGVEAEPGRKDPALVRAFMSAVHRSNARLANTEEGAAI